MKDRNKGFTLAELLIVVAIIAVLVAISIPVFTNQLEKSREATDLANVRAAYAEVMVAVLAEDADSEYINSKGTAEKIKKDDVYSATVILCQHKEGWINDAIHTVGDVTKGDSNWHGDPIGEGGKCTIEYADNEVHLYWNGKYHDYVGNMKDAVSKTASGSWCLNSTNGNNNTIKKMLGNLTDFTTKSDILTWAAVKNNTSSDYTYIYSTVDIKGSDMLNKQIPAIMCDASGNYTVGYATVNKAPDKAENATDQYNVITITSDNQYPYTYPNGPSGGGVKNSSYDTSKLLTGSTYTGTDAAAAQDAYNKLLVEYNRNS